MSTSTQIPFCHTFVNFFGIPLLPEAGSIGYILLCHIVTNKPDQLVNIFMFISAFQHPWLRGFIFPCWAFDRPALDTFLLSSHFLLHRLFSFPPAIPAPFTPLQLCHPRRVDDVNLVTPVNPVTPITPFTPSPPSPHHHPLHHPSWRWWPTSRRGRTEVDWVSKTVPVYLVDFYLKVSIILFYVWLLFLDSIPINLSGAPYRSLDWRYK